MGLALICTMRWYQHCLREGLRGLRDACAVLGTVSVQVKPRSGSDYCFFYHYFQYQIQRLEEKIQSGKHLIVCITVLVKSILQVLFTI